MKTGHYLLQNLEALRVTFSPEQPLCWPSALYITNYNCKTPQHSIKSKTMMRLPNIIFSLTSSAVTLFLRQWSLISPLWRKNNFQASFFINKNKCLIFWKCKRGANIVQALVLNSRHTFLDSVLSSILPQRRLPNPKFSLQPWEQCILDLIYVPQRYSAAIKKARIAPQQVGKIWKESTSERSVTQRKMT